MTQFLYQGLSEIGSLQEGKLTELRVLGYGKGGDTGAAVLLELEGQNFVPIHDIHGHVVALFDLQGNLVQRYHYDAFGNIHEDGALTPWQAFSKRLDSESAFLCFNKRYYIALLGRFLTPDPLSFADGPNLYAYVHNNPLSLFDPYGLLSLREGWDFTKGFGNGIWDRVADTASSTASLLKTSSDYSAPQLVSDYYRDRPAYDSKIINAQEFMQGLGLYFQESSKDFNSAGTALADLFIPGCREVQNLSSKTSFFDAGRAWGHAVTDMALCMCGGRLVNITKMEQVNKALSVSRLPFGINSPEKLSVINERTKIAKIAGNRNRFTPHPNAVGAHSIFRKDPISGKITHYETYRPQTNPNNPKSWESVKRYDGPGNVDGRHYNKFLRQYIDTPHIHDPYAPGGVRLPEKWEIPN